MNTHWKTFLSARHALVNGDNRKTFPLAENSSYDAAYPLTHLAVLRISGKDAANLLQGQTTCNINDINEQASKFAAICNPKGRTIATFLLVKNAADFLMVLPAELAETIRKRLTMYVLRSDAKIQDADDEFCLMGLTQTGKPVPPFTSSLGETGLIVNFPGTQTRKLVIAEIKNATRLWAEHVDIKKFYQANSEDWRYLDIISGIPWVTSAASEEFIPQMLNLDKLGGISFNKGCYTGQEIVARTHYLGKVKRELFLAECQTATAPPPNTAIINRASGEGEIVGNVLQSIQNGRHCTLQIVLQTTDTDFKRLGLREDDQSQLTIIPFANA